MKQAHGPIKKDKRKKEKRKRKKENSLDFYQRQGNSFLKPFYLFLFSLFMLLRLVLKIFKFSHKLKTHTF
jgi:hypothetical protein